MTPRLISLYGSIALALVAAGCGSSSSSSINVVAEPAGANCASGGIKVSVGSGPASYVCNGATGTAGAAAQVTAEAAGANCADGGIKVQISGESPFYICNGAPGTAAPGATVTQEEPGANCAAGGIKVTVGSGAPTYVCNGSGATGATGSTGATGANGSTGSTGSAGSTGATGPAGGPVGPTGATGAVGASGSNGTNGTNGQGASISTVDPGVDSPCPNGGIAVTVGDGAPSYVCNGASGDAGADGQSVTVTPDDPNCPNGGVSIQVGTSGASSDICNGSNGTGATISTINVGDQSNCNGAGGVLVTDGNGNSTAVCNGALGPGGVIWTVVSNDVNPIAVNQGYFVEGGANQLFHLYMPSSAGLNVGDTVRVQGMDSPWEIYPADSQSFVYGAQATGIAGINWRPAPGFQWLAVASSSDGSKVVAASSSGQLFVSQDAGATWLPRTPARNWSGVASDSSGQYLAAVTSNDAAGDSGAIYTSDDYGATWNEQPGLAPSSWHGVASSADGTRLVLCSIDGPIVIGTTANNGVSWTWTTTAGAPSNLQWLAVASNAAGDHLFAASASAPAGNGIYVSGDSGVTWTQSQALVAEYWTTISSDSTGAFLVAGTLGGTLYNSETDSDTPAAFGMSWHAQLQASGNLPAWLSSSESAGGTIMAASRQDGTIWFSLDHGEDWSTEVLAPNTLAVAVAISGDGTKGIAMNQDGTDSRYTLTTPSNPPTLSSGQFQSLTAIASSADGSKLVVAALGGFIYNSADSGATWLARDSSPGVQQWTGVASSANGARLVAVTAPPPDVIHSDITHSYLFISDDSGETWTELSTLGAENWTAVASSADGETLIGATDGNNLYVSTDRGLTWSTNSPQLNWTAVASSSDGTKLVAVETLGLGNNAGGNIYTSVDSGESWTLQGLAGPGFQHWSSVASSADGTRLVASTAGGDSDGTIWISTDSGVTWTWSTSNGLPGGNWTGVASSADGVNLAAVATGSPYIYTSPSGGLYWFQFQVSALLNPVAQQSLAAVAWAADGSKLAAVNNSTNYFTAGVFVSAGPVGQTSVGNGSIWGPQGSAVEMVFAGTDMFTGLPTWNVVSSAGQLSAY